MADKAVRAVLVNIFAGINRCDWVAEGVVQAWHEVKMTLPLIVRLAGTNVDAGNRILKESGIPIIAAETLADAAAKAVQAASLKTGGRA
jgi:malate-CoA ligase subunit beta